MTSPNHDMIECPREADVLDALASARWPDHMDEELAAHVRACGICQDVIAVASALQADHDAAWHNASVPSSGQMWWRAEMRARQDAIRDASRPVTVAQSVAAGLVLAVAGIGGWVAWPAVQDFFSWTAIAQTPVLASPIILPLAIAMGALLVVAPVALYLVLSEK